MTPEPDASGEGTPATILFADILGFDALAEQRGLDDAFDIVTGCLARLDEIVRRHGGAADRYLGDCLMAVFGFPMRSPAPEENAARAALAMVQAVAEVSAELGPNEELSIHIGVHSGPILAGDVRGGVIREFAVIGDAVNIAARLKEKAPPGEIWVGSTTEAASRDALVYRPLDESRLKGKQATVLPYRLEAEREGGGARRTPHLAPLVGRDAELEKLSGAVERLVKRREGAVVWLAGATGSGKSRLLEELTARHSDVPVTQIPASDFDRADAPDHGSRPRLLILDETERAPEVVLDTLRAWLPLAATLPVLVIIVVRPPETPAISALAERAAALGARFTRFDLAPLGPEDVSRLIEAVRGDGLDEASRALVTEHGGGNPGRLLQAAFLPDALQADEARRELQPQRTSEAERRRATVLFADLTGFTAMTEALERSKVHALVTSCLDLLTQVAERHGGSVEKHLGDCVLAVFGAPVAMEDAPRAAVNAALEMRERVAAWNVENEIAEPLEVHTGIDTGVGVAGEVAAGPVTREFTLMGASVNRASKLKDVAPAGQIYVGDETWRATREAFAYESVDAEGTPAHEVRAAAPQLHREGARRRRVASQLVGRDAELKQLVTAVTELAAGRGGFMGLMGEAGLGKSRLVAELAAMLPPEVLMLEARSISIGGALPLHPFADLLRRFCERREEDDDEAALGRLEEATRRLLGDESQEVLPFLARVAGLPLSEPDRERLERIQGEALQKLILGAMTRLLREIAKERPLLLVFEDLYWADVGSIELLESLLHLAETSPILVMGVSRPHYGQTSERIHTAARERLGDRSREVRLAPLQQDAAGELLKNLFGGAAVPARLLAAVRARSAGNPFYVEEVVRSLLDSGALEERGALLVPTQHIESVEIPGTIQEVVMARVDRLDRERRAVLRAAAAIGVVVPVDVLEEVVGKDGLDEQIEALVEAELLRREASTAQVFFQHPLVQEVIYDSLVENRRQELHRKVGAAIERRLSERAPGYHAMLAYHFTQGRDLERAEPHLFLAGDEASRAAASDEALRFFQQASEVYLELHGDDGDTVTLALLERNIALALANRGRHVESVQHFDAALRRRGVSVNRSRLVMRLRLVRDLAVVLGRLYLGRTPDRVATDTERAVQELIYERARVQTTNAPDQYLFDWLDGLRRLQTVDPTSLPLAGGQYASTVGIFSYGGVSFGTSERFLVQARQIVEEVGDPEDRMIFGFMNFFHYTLAGDWSEKHLLPEEFVEERLRDGQLFDVTNYWAFVADQRVLQGRFEEALDVMRRIEGIADLYQYDLARSSIHGLEAALDLEQELWDDAVRAADVHYTEHEDAILNLLALGNKAKAEIGAGQRDAARATLELAERLLSDAPGVVPPYQKSAVLRSRLLFEVDALEQGGGNPRAARRASRLALNAATRVAARRAEVWRLEGRRLFQAGHRKRAARAWHRAEAEAKHLGMEPELRRIAADRARD